MAREFSHGGGGYAEQKHATENPPPCSELSTLPSTTPAASTESGDAAAKTGAEDVLYGEEYVGDFMYNLSPCRRPPFLRAPPAGEVARGLWIKQ
ncbi:hypothetical protein ACFX2I_041794 [Malus domestica]